MAAMAQTLTVEMQPQLTLRPSPHMCAYAELLAVPTLELEQAIDAELAENPALERVEPEAPVPRPSDSALDVAAPAEQTLADRLLAELRLLVEPTDEPVAEFLTGSLDERGFLDTTVDEVAHALGVSATRVARVVALLQQAEPPGIGARGVRECLLIQIDRRPGSRREKRLARKIIGRHFEQLGKGRYEEIARSVGSSTEEVLRTRDWIRAELRPYPILPGDSRPPALEPDIAVRERPGEPGTFAVELLERRRFELRVAPAYDDAAARLPAGSERELVEWQVGQARAFLQRIERRWETIRRVAQEAVDRQCEFVARGPRFLLRLTRAEIAGQLGVHESTVGRAVAGRHVLLPDNRVVPLAAFFERSDGAATALTELVAAEDHPKPDAELAEDLLRLGYTIARRTVAKYRDRLGIPAHTLR